MSRKHIDKLTASQEAELPRLRDEWLSIGLRVGGDLDMAKIRVAVDAAYATAKLPPLRFLIRLASPLAVALGPLMLRGQQGKPVGAQVGDQVVAQVVAQVRDQVGDQVWAQVRDQVVAQVVAQVRDQVGDQVRDQVRDQVVAQVWAQVGAQVRDQVGAQVRDQVVAQVRDQVGAQVVAQVGAQVGDQVGDQVWASLFAGQYEAGWLSWFAAFNYFGLAVTERMRGLLGMAREGCWYSLWNQAAFVCERPVHLHRDDRNRLHCEDDAAIKWSDGWGVYAWHGTRVPAAVITQPETLTVAAIKAEQNAEIRRVMRERFGEDRYLRETGAKLVHADYETARKGAAPRALVQDDEGRRFLFGTDGSTGRTYTMEVPPDVKTCRAAHVALCGFDEKLILNKS